LKSPVGTSKVTSSSSSLEIEDLGTNSKDESNEEEDKGEGWRGGQGGPKVLSHIFWTILATREWDDKWPWYVHDKYQFNNTPGQRDNIQLSFLREGEHSPQP